MNNLKAKYEKKIEEAKMKAKKEIARLEGELEAIEALPIEIAENISHVFMQNSGETWVSLEKPAPDPNAAWRRGYFTFREALALAHKLPMLDTVSATIAQGSCSIGATQFAKQGEPRFPGDGPFIAELRCDIHGEVEAVFYGLNNDEDRVRLSFKLGKISHKLRAVRQRTYSGMTIVESTEAIPAPGAKRITWLATGKEYPRDVTQLVYDSVAFADWLEPIKEVV